MEELLVLHDTTYLLKITPTDCMCEDCEGLRSAGYQTYESFSYLGEMLIGSDCYACSQEEAFDSAELMCEMFHRGELGSQAHNWFTPQAIEHVERRIG